MFAGFSGFFYFRVVYRSSSGVWAGSGFLGALLRVGWGVGSSFEESSSSSLFRLLALFALVLLSSRLSKLKLSSLSLFLSFLASLAARRAFVVEVLMIVVWCRDRSVFLVFFVSLGVMFRDSESLFSFSVSFSERLGFRFFCFSSVVGVSSDGFSFVFLFLFF